MTNLKTLKTVENDSTFRESTKGGVLYDNAHVSINDGAFAQSEQFKFQRKPIANRDGSARTLRFSSRNMENSQAKFTFKKKPANTQDTQLGKGTDKRPQMESTSQSKSVIGGENRSKDSFFQNHREINFNHIKDEKEKMKLVKLQAERDRRNISEFILQPSRFFLNPNEQTYNQLTEFMSSKMLEVFLFNPSGSTQNA